MECTLVFVPSDFLQLLCQLMRLDTDSLETKRDIFLFSHAFGIGKYSSLCESR
jgi:hypothetical protein